MKFIRDVDGYLVNLTLIESIVADDDIVQAHSPDSGDYGCTTYNLYKGSKEECELYMQRLETQLGRNGLLVEVVL